MNTLAFSLIKPIRCVALSRDSCTLSICSGSSVAIRDDGGVEAPYTLKNKGASRCHRKTFLSKWFHKEPLTSEEPLCFTKDYLW